MRVPSTLEGLNKILDLDEPTIRMISCMVDDNVAEELSMIQARSIVLADMLITNVGISTSLTTILLNHLVDKHKLSDSCGSVIMQILDGSTIVVTEDNKLIAVMNKKGEILPNMPDHPPLMMVTIVLASVFSRVRV